MKGTDDLSSECLVLKPKKKEKGREKKSPGSGAFFVLWYIFNH
jgi:hypothetical protein